MDTLRKKRLKQLARVLTTPEVSEEMMEHNYQLAKRHYSYAVLRRKLHGLIFDILGDIGITHEM